jgi:hypothetical protein
MVDSPQTIDGIRFFLGADTQQVDGVTLAAAEPDQWYYEPADYDGDVLWSQGYCDLDTAREVAEERRELLGGILEWRKMRRREQILKRQKDRLSDLVGRVVGMVDRHGQTRWHFARALAHARRASPRECARADALVSVLVQGEPGELHQFIRDHESYEPHGFESDLDCIAADVAGVIERSRQVSE